MLNVKQGSCEYQLLKSFSLTRLGNRTLVYQLRGKRSLGHATVYGGVAVPAPLSKGGPKWRDNYPGGLTIQSPPSNRQ